MSRPVRRNSREWALTRVSQLEVVETERGNPGLGYTLESLWIKWGHLCKTTCTEPDRRGSTPVPACASSSPAFLMMYSAYKLNKQSDSIQPWHNPFPIWNQSVVLCPVLTVASWPAYRFSLQPRCFFSAPLGLTFSMVLQMKPVQLIWEENRSYLF